MLKKIKNQKSNICILIFIFLFIKQGFCDILRLKEIPEGSEGNEVDILEEKDDSFIIKIPKDEIEVIKRKRPTDIKAWREKRIFWEDTGDYLTIYLPKEKIILPEDYTGDEYDSAKVLKDKLTGMAQEARPPEAVFWRGTGKIVGRILKAGQPVSVAKVKIVNVPSPVDAFTRVLTPTDKQPQELVFEATTDESGQFVFSNIPLGEYDIYWSLPGTDSWYRRLSEKPDIAIRPGETVRYPDIEIK